MTPEQFIRKWTAANLSERSAAQQHFLDLCALLGEPTPAEADPEGNTFTFEKGGTTATGGHGWADVWKKGAFAWEYKGPGKDLNAAYLQLKKYADMLENPPLLITSDTKRIEIHTNFTNTVKVMHALEVTDLANPAKRDMLRYAFTNPEELRPGVTRQQVTTEAAATFSALAHHLQGKGYEPKRVAHFLNRIIFCMFAEDVGLLPNRIFSKLTAASVAHPEAFEANAKQLFAGMSKGGSVAFEVIDWFNGGLFDDDATLPLDKAELELVLKCAEMDWSNIEPSIFGTLFERGLDPDKRSQQGAHYTDPATIMRIVRPVVLEPWEREWETEKLALSRLADRSKKTVSEAAKQRLFTFLDKLAKFRVLDPACGSGNFLYLALRGLKDFEKRVILEAETLGLPVQFPHVGPNAVLGLEVNPYAAELARVTIWIGELQWMLENGFPGAKNPILKPLDQIECRDAILNDDDSEPTWPQADVIVGNPPFVGDKKMIRELGESYVARLRNLYRGRVSGGADLVCYWFIKAGSMLANGTVRRVGLVSTNSICFGQSNKVLQLATRNADIFCAWQDLPWINEGAAVRVSMVCFGRPGESAEHTVNGVQCLGIRANLDPVEGSPSDVDLTTVGKVQENRGISFVGVALHGPFEIEPGTARSMLTSFNPHRGSNSEVIRRSLNGMDITRRPVERWLVDFGPDRTEAQSALFEKPFAFVVEVVKPVRFRKDKDGVYEVRRKAHRDYWWRFGETRPAMRRALKGLSRYLVAPMVSKHRLFVWLPPAVLPDQKLVVFARADDTFMGVLSSAFHRVWSIKVGNRIGAGNDPTYNNTVCFETFPFPQGLTPDLDSTGYTDDPRAQRIATVAKYLNELRENWLNPPELIDRILEVVPGYPDRMQPKNVAAEKELKNRTLTNLYNTNPTWLQNAHRELDEAVAAAYEWEWPMADIEIVRRLFELNQQRALPLDARPKTKKPVKSPKKR